MARRERLGMWGCSVTGLTDAEDPPTVLIREKEKI
jgi:hypothetical protein